MSRASIRIYDDGYRLQLKWYADDTAHWRRILDDFKATFRTHSERSYNSTTRTWSVPLWCRRRLEEWADYWFAGDAQQWEDEQPTGYRYGGRTRSDTRSSYERFGKGQAGTSAIEAAFATLHLLPTAPPELVQAAHRTLVKVHHPDVGGDTQVMTRINLAVQKIREHHEEKAS
jgi:hypothetical protein